MRLAASLLLLSIVRCSRGVVSLFTNRMPKQKEYRLAKDTLLCVVIIELGNYNIAITFLKILDHNHQCPF